MQKTIYKEMFDDLLDKLTKEYDNDYLIKSVEIKNGVNGAYIIATITKPSENKTKHWQFLSEEIIKIYTYDEDYKLVELHNNSI